MPKFMLSETIASSDVITVRLGTATKSTTATASVYKDADAGKFVKLVGASRYALCAAGDAIEGRISSVEVASQDDYVIGGVIADADFFSVTLDGLQATPGTGVVAIGDYVLCGTVVAIQTALTVPAKVCKATDQAVAKAAPFGWRVVSIGATGADGVSGAVGVVAVIQSVF